MKKAIELFGQYTNGRFDPYLLAGPANVGKRVEVLTLLLGKKPKQKDAGARNLTDTLFQVLEVPDGCLATRYRELARICGYVLKLDPAQ